MIKNIVFDVGGVLLTNITDKFILDRIKYKDDVDVVFKEIFNSKIRVDLDRGLYDEKTAIEKMISNIPDRSKDDAVFIYKYFMTHRETSKGIVEIIYGLKEKGYNLYILTNFGLNFREFCKINKLEFIDIFDGVFVSSEHNLIKPDKMIYKSFLEKFNIKAEESYFVDDNEENVVSAKKLGFNGLVFSNSECLLADLFSMGVCI